MIVSQINFIILNVGPSICEKSYYFKDKQRSIGAHFFRTEWIRKKGTPDMYPKMGSFYSCVPPIFKFCKMKNQTLWNYPHQCSYNLGCNIPPILCRLSHQIICKNTTCSIAFNRSNYLSRHLVNEKWQP